MDLSKLSYSKSDLERPLETPVNKPASKIDDRGETPCLSEMSPDYKKTEGIFSTNLVFVLSGGEKREKDFLRELIMQRQLHSLRVAFVSEKGQGLQPYQMQAKWERIQASGMVKIDAQVFHLDALDKIFLLTDVDEFYEQLAKIFKSNSADSQGQWIVSNPCFEIWLYYCYLNNPETDLADLKSEPVAQRSKKLKALGNTLVSGGLNPRSAFERMEIGIKHSKAHFGVDENGIPVLFSTQIHEMAQYMVDMMNRNANEYAVFVKKKIEWRKSFKK